MANRKKKEPLCAYIPPRRIKRFKLKNEVVVAFSQSLKDAYAVEH